MVMVMLMMMLVSMMMFMVMMSAVLVMVVIMIALLLGVLFAVVNLTRLSRIRFSDEDIPPAETVPATSAGVSPAPVSAVDL